LPEIGAYCGGTPVTRGLAEAVVSSLSLNAQQGTQRPAGNATPGRERVVPALRPKPPNRVAVKSENHYHY